MLMKNKLTLRKFLQATMKKTLILTMLVLFSVSAAAQRRSKSPARPHSYVASIIKQYNDSLALLKERYANWRYAQPDTLENPYYFYIYSSPTFYNAPVHRLIGTLPTADSIPSRPSGVSPAPLSAVTTLTDQIDRSLLDVYATAPWLVLYDEMQDMDNEGLRSDLSTEIKPHISLADRYGSQEEKPAPAIDTEDLQIIVRRPNFWKFKTSFSLQFLQNYVSDNWYKGGENYNSFLASLVTEANYNNKQKITFDNKLEMKLGFQSSRNDERHKYKTNSDLIRLTNKLGLRATKHWYYTFMLQSWTQFHRGFKSNDDHVYSDFMSPFESLFSIGMNYSITLKRFNASATLSPFACDFKYVDRKYLATSFGIKANHHSNFDFGSNITATYTWNICKNVQWGGRVYFFTDYSRAQIEWENTFNLTINKYLSTKLFLYPRFDDGASRKEGCSYFQFNEYLSVGLNVSF